VVRRLAASVCDAPPAELRARATVRQQLLGSLGAWNWENALDSVAVPRLIVIGDGDVALDEVARRWATAGPGRLLIAGRSFHFPWIDAPERISSAMEEFLVRRQWPAGAAQVSAVSLR
jgi:pimeloyl-ACP methyl ester carboxylesterase